MSQPPYWIVSVPYGDGSVDNSFRELKEAVSKSRDLATPWLMQFPKLRVGTLDNLMALSDELGKHDVLIDSITKRIAKQLLELLRTRPGEEENKSDGVSSKVLTKASLEVNGLQVETYLTRFQWDEAKYPLKSGMGDIVGQIMKQITAIDEEMKTNIGQYMNIKQKLLAIERKSAGNLMIRDLGDVVKQEDFVESENLTTLLIVVPSYLQKDWLKEYEGMTKFVVPRSSKQLASDNEYTLYSVVVFKRIADDFKLACREKRYQPRDFTFDASNIQASADQTVQLEADLKRSWARLVTWCQANFGEAFAAWVHLKVLRVFVESVLRYGLPAEYMSVLLKPKPKQSRKLNSVLEEVYHHLAGKGQDNDEIDYDDSRSLHEAYFPYVFSALFADFGS